MKENIMLKRLLIMMLLLALPMLTLAQDETESEEDIVPYFQAGTGFNVPVLGDNWERETSDTSILYRDTATQANIFVNTVRTLDDEEAILVTLESVMTVPIDNMVYDGRIGLLNGTWTQRNYQAGDTSISAFSLVRSDRTFVIVYWEESQAYDTHFLIARVPNQEAEDGELMMPDPMTGIIIIQEALNGETFDTQPENTQTITRNGDEWLQVTYPTNATPYNVFGYQFRDYTYVASITGELTDANTQNIDDFTRLLLGFFITPDNSNYLYLGLGASAIIFLTLIGSMWLRFQNTAAEMKLVEQIAADN